MEPKEEYKEVLEEKQQAVLSQIDLCQTVTRERIEECKQAIRRAKAESMGADGSERR